MEVGMGTHSWDRQKKHENWSACYWSQKNVKSREMSSLLPIQSAKNRKKYTNKRFHHEKKSGTTSVEPMDASRHSRTSSARLWGFKRHSTFLGASSHLQWWACGNANMKIYEIALSSWAFAQRCTAKKYELCDAGQSGYEGHNICR